MIGGTSRSWNGGRLVQLERRLVLEAGIDDVRIRRRARTQDVVDERVGFLRVGQLGKLGLQPLEVGLVARLDLERRDETRHLIFPSNSEAAQASNGSRYSRSQVPSTQSMIAGACSASQAEFMCACSSSSLANDSSTA